MAGRGDDDLGRVAERRVQERRQPGAGSIARLLGGDTENVGHPGHGDTGCQENQRGAEPGHVEGDAGHCDRRDPDELDSLAA